MRLALLSLHHPCQFAQAGTQAVAATAQAVAPLASTVLDATAGIPSMLSDVQTLCDPTSRLLAQVLAGGDLARHGRGLRAS